MKKLIILAHPNIENSRINRSWKEELKKFPDEITIHELYKEYPDYNIDVQKEQNMIEAYTSIIIQFPLYWYSSPPLLKKWFDDVFTYGWAYGSHGKKLKNKKLGLAISIGDEKKNYSPNGSVSFTPDQIITPFKATAIHTGMILLPYFSLFNASFNITEYEIKQSSKDYIDYIFTN